MLAHSKCKNKQTWEILKYKIFRISVVEEDKLIIFT